MEKNSLSAADQHYLLLVDFFTGTVSSTQTGCRCGKIQTRKYKISTGPGPDNTFWVVLENIFYWVSKKYYNTLWFSRNFQQVNNIFKSKFLIILRKLPNAL